MLMDGGADSWMGARMSCGQEPPPLEVQHRGDYVGDRLQLMPMDFQRAEAIRPYLTRLLELPRFTVAVFGGSGTGKSEVACILADRLEALLRQQVYVVSCDNYPHLPPSRNDAHRRELFEQGGPEGLAAFLGTDQELNFSRLNAVVQDFRSGEPEVRLRLMNRLTSTVETEVRALSTSGLRGMLFEGTWSGLTDCALRIFLRSTPAQTQERRLLRARDGHAAGDPLIETVLQIEQQKLDMLGKVAAHLVVEPEGLVSITSLGLRSNLLTL